MRSVRSLSEAPALIGVAPVYVRIGPGLCSVACSLYPAPLKWLQPWTQISGVTVCPGAKFCFVGMACENSVCCSGPVLESSICSWLLSRTSSVKWMSATCIHTHGATRSASLRSWSDQRRPQYSNSLVRSHRCTCK